MNFNFESIKQHLPWIVLVLLVVVIGIANPSFFSASGLISLFVDIVPLFIIALGMTFAIYVGGIDLSSEQTANLITVVANVFLTQFGIRIALVCPLIGFFIGTISGYATIKLYEPSFVSTLAMGFVSTVWGEVSFRTTRALHGPLASGCQFWLDF